MHGLQPGDEVPSGSHGCRHDAIHSVDLAFHARCCAIRAPAQQRPSQPSPAALKKIALTLGIALDKLVFGGTERGPDDDLLLQFEAVGRLPPRCARCWTASSSSTRRVDGTRGALPAQPHASAMHGKASANTANGNARDAGLMIH